jgi:hypothetical protein
MAAFSEFFEYPFIVSPDWCYKDFPLSDGRNCSAIKSLFYCVFNNTLAEADTYLFKYFGTSRQQVAAMVAGHNGTSGKTDVGKNGVSNGHRMVMSVIVVIFTVILIS